MSRQALVAGRWYRVALIAALGALSAPAVDAGDTGIEQARKKLGLLESYLQSGAAARIQMSGNSEAQGMLEQAQALHTSALGAIESGSAERATRDLAEGLRVFSRATMVLQDATKKTDEVRQRLGDLRQEIQAYRASFSTALAGKGPAEAGLLDTGRLDELMAQARSHEHAGMLKEAERALREAQFITATALSRLRRNETVAYALEFRTPADEFRYEKERNHGLVLLVEQMRAEGKVPQSAGPMVEQFTGQGRALATQAEGEAASGDYRSAIKTMEQANRSYGRALQMMGLPFSG